MTDVLLVFPPLTEAVQFPYLALPQLASAWRAQGISVLPLDLNLVYRQTVLTADGNEDTRHEIAGARTPADLYRNLAEDYRRRQGARILTTSRDRSVGFEQESAIQAAARFTCRQAERDRWLLDDVASIHDVQAAVEDSADSWSVQVCTDLLVKQLQQSEAAVLAFSVPFFSQVVPTLSLLCAVKRQLPDVRVVLGGPTVQMWSTVLQRHIPVACKVDHWCTGHGEGFMATVLDGTAGQTSTHDLDDGMNINQQVCPDFTGLSLDDYSNQAHQFPYRLTLGCFWGRCTFCSYGNRYLAARAFQQIAPDRAAEHLLALAADLQVTDVAVCDENTGLRHLMRIMRAAKARGADLTYRVRARLEPELADLDFCRTLRELGCIQISAGMETMDQTILDSVDKGQQAVTAEIAVRNLADAGITLNLSFMDGFDHPNAVRAAQDTARMIHRNTTTMGLDTMQLLVAEPGSRLWESRKREQGGEFLVSNAGLAFGAGRFGGRLLAAEQTERARSRLRDMAVNAVPVAERSTRPDLLEAPATGQTVHKARPRLGVSVGRTDAGHVLYDVAWPSLARIPESITETAAGQLVGDVGPAREWLTAMVHKRLLIDLGAS